MDGSLDVLRKISTATDSKKVVDGHAPGLSGKELNAYIASGVRSDHECTTAEEAMEENQSRSMGDDQRGNSL